MNDVNDAADLLGAVWSLAFQINETRNWCLQHAQGLHNVAWGSINQVAPVTMFLASLRSLLFAKLVFLCLFFLEPCVRCHQIVIGAWGYRFGLKGMMGFIYPLRIPSPLWTSDSNSNIFNSHIF